MPRSRVDRFLSGDGLGLALDAEYIDAADEALAFFETAAMAAADELADYGKRAFRSDIEAALGPRIAKTLRARVFPERGKQSLGPAVEWRSKAPRILAAFSEAQTLRSPRGRFLAIPSEAARAIRAPRVVGSDGNVRRGRAALIGAVERRYGKLRHVFLPGKKYSLLVADNVRITKTGRVSSNITRRRDGTSYSRLQGRTTVVMFILVPQVRTRKLLNLDSVSSVIAGRASQIFVRAFADIAQRHFPGEG
ncbi:DUF6441 family protein [Hyphobacterium sp.]|uniref:DUF6441 family protein n=1 Tax=Hyphobacterium sp. TaxID=2004662 RepID=UPI003B527336